MLIRTVLLENVYGNGIWGADFFHNIKFNALKFFGRSIRVSLVDSLVCLCIS